MRARLLVVLLAVLSLSVWGCETKSDASASKTEEKVVDDHSGHDHAGHDHSAHEQAAATDTATATELAAQTTCPIMGGDINKELYVDHDGKRIYVCCGACLSKVKEDPAAAIGKLKELGQKPETL